MIRPQRVVGFNASVTHNDGLLAQSLMRREGLDYDAAMRFIADSVMTFRQQLAMDCEVSMGRIGYFRRNEGRYIEFVPFYHGMATDLFFGLSDLDIKSVSKLEQERIEQEAADEAPAAVIAKERNIFTRKASRIAASIVALIGLGIVFSTPIIVNQGQHDNASMAPTVTAPRPQQLTPTVQEGVVAQPVAPVVSAFPKISATGNATGKYYMVVATLRNQQEMEAFKRKNADLVPLMKVLDYKGMMCVYVARSDDYGKLMSLRGELPERLRDIWIYN